jgi:3-phenylpropionate/trans-cinnamate dioxygenase ferredoxin reductase subunit
MADRTVDILLIGGGIASATAAHTLREQGFNGSILLVGREPHPPYHRPPCSKEYLRGEHGPETAHVHPADWWEPNGVELLTRTSGLDLDTEARTAKLSTKEEVGFDRALIATGAMVRRLPVDGAQLEGIHYLRALGNADTIREESEGAERVVCVGGSYIGSEVAASLTELGKQVTMVMLEDHPLERGFGTTAGRFFRRVLEEHGVEVVGGEEIARFEGNERVERVVTAGGRELPAQAVICGVGATPDVMLARKAGLTLGELGGVLCDSGLRTSPPPGAPPPRATCWAPTSPTTRCPTSSPISPTGPRSSTSARPTTGTTSRSRARSTTASSRSGTARASGCGRC